MLIGLTKRAANTRSGLPSFVADRYAEQGVRLSADDTPDEFYLFENARFAEPGNQEKRERFQELGKIVLPQLTERTGATVVSTGVSAMGIWAVWNISDVPKLWSAMTFSGNSPEYARMQKLIVGEDQNFCHMYRRYTRDVDLSSAYRYAIISRDVNVVQYQETLFNFENMFLDPGATPWSWSMILATVTGGLYRVTRLWRCDTSARVVDVTDASGEENVQQAEVWVRGSYEPSQGEV